LEERKKGRGFPSGGGKKNAARRKPSRLLFDCRREEEIDFLFSRYRGKEGRGKIQHGRRG